jgi:hypothetical protein
MQRLSGRVVLSLALALAVAGCDTQDPTTTPTTPTTTTPTVTETFAGTLSPGGAATFPFGTDASGVVTARLAKLSPEDTKLVGLALGTWNGATCQVLLTNDQATQGVTVTGNVSGAGALCVRIYDSASQLTQANTFQLSVIHP